MAYTINNMELKKKSLIEKLAGLSDFRRGTISVNYRKCGKKNCACAKSGHPVMAHSIFGTLPLKEKAMQRI